MVVPSSKIQCVNVTGSPPRRIFSYLKWTRSKLLGIQNEEINVETRISLTSQLNLGLKDERGRVVGLRGLECCGKMKDNNKDD